MAHPVLWPKTTYFYPIGNTTPVCFTETLAPENNAEILLLGCGDPRSILYTIHADLAPGNRKMDFTCCDWQPAILARNILLFTMIADGVPSDHLWAIFYHLFLDQTSYDLLVAQCRTMIEISSDLHTWKESKYGNYLRFCTNHSLAEVRRQWISYADADCMSRKDKDALRSTFISGMKSVRDCHIKSDGDHKLPFRASGPLLATILGTDVNSFKVFWSKGVMPSTFSESVSHPHVNPTFAYSVCRKDFNVHYGTDPLNAFFLAPYLASSKGVKLAITTKTLVEGAMKQFASWCSSFKARIDSANQVNLTIRFFSGESLALCRALRRCSERKDRETGIYANLWGGTQITFDEEDFIVQMAPVNFSVIDTSNLADHLGLLNILIVTVPLLQRSPWSVIHTDSLVRNAGPSSGSKTILQENALIDIPTLSLMLGIAPSPYLSHIATHSSKRELFLLSPSTQFHERITWRITSSAIPNSLAGISGLDSTSRLACNPTQLAKFFYSVYLQMFANENMAGLLDISKYFKKLQISYLRSSLAAFLSLVKINVDVDWTRTMDIFIGLVEDDRSLITGSNNYQDLICQLHLHNVYTAPTLLPEFIHGFPNPSSAFQGWKDIPPVICVVLSVPRSRIKILEDIPSKKLGTTMLQCESLYGISFHNIHPSIQSVFGNMKVSEINNESQVVIDEDPLGFDGNSPLIVSFYMPSWILLKFSPDNFIIGLHLRSTPDPRNFGLFVNKFGIKLNIFSAAVADKEHVQISRLCPNNVTNYVDLPKTSRQSVTVNFDTSGTSTAAKSLSIRRDIKETEMAKSLLDGAAVSFKPLADCTVLVSFGGYEQLFNFPFPILGQQVKLKIARNSHYIEAECPIRPNFEDFQDFSLGPFPIVQTKEIFNLVNIHYVSLERLPTLKLPKSPKELQWLNFHLTTTLSAPEKRNRELKTLQNRGTLLNLRESLFVMFSKFSGIDVRNAQINFFGLTDPGRTGVYAIIFINDLKLDLSSHTILLDACVVPLIRKNMDKQSSGLQRLANLGLTQIVTDDDEIRAWKILLPTLAERCRTWEHLSSCSYVKNGVPAALEGFNESPICGCGKGKNLGPFGNKLEWKTFHSEATRIAIGPLFSFMLAEETRVTADSKLSESKKNISLLNNKNDKDSTLSSSKCFACSGPGQPTLLACSTCKKAKYCSKTCQKSHWKMHKLQCNATS